MCKLIQELWVYVRSVRLKHLWPPCSWVVIVSPTPPRRCSRQPAREWSPPAYQLSVLWLPVCLAPFSTLTLKTPSMSFWIRSSKVASVSACPRHRDRGREHAPHQMWLWGVVYCRGGLHFERKWGLYGSSTAAAECRWMLTQSNQPSCVPDHQDPPPTHAPHVSSMQIASTTWVSRTSSWCGPVPSCCRLPLAPPTGPATGWPPPSCPPSLSSTTTAPR